MNMQVNRSRKSSRDQEFVKQGLSAKLLPFRRQLVVGDLV